MYKRQQLNKVSLVDKSLTHHGMSHLHEAGDIRSLHVVDVAIRFCPIFYALSMNCLLYTSLSVLLVVATQAKGSVLIHQKMFESRLFFVDKLIDMGAQIIQMCIRDRYQYPVSK